ncbi:unnamed protein product [Bursaphelenchus okinawaensis]|uniref:Uncharacterized protein n=1 Tax=Bursaphelenchus okinawaensis TaxID=465554 RepID=A0A811LME6_9BILA|nr:unnamed protein product [Bursaphelenchus okinawaensis]CAG9125206.1 unnamed protein product [Bursaphelenchus okinawaensis]
MTDHQGHETPRAVGPLGIVGEEPAAPNSRHNFGRKPTIVAKTSSLGLQAGRAPAPGQPPPQGTAMHHDENEVQVPQVHRLSTISARVGHPTHAGLSHLPHHPLNSTVIDWQSGGSRRTSVVFSRRPTSSNIPITSNVPLRPSSGSLLELADRTSSKLTLDEELYDILFAFG